MSPCPRFARIAFITLAAASLAACSDDEQPGPIDAPTIDAAIDAAVVDAPAVDAPTDAPTIDAPTDAPPPIDAPSSVQVVQCPGNPDLTISAASGAFVPMSNTITVNQIVRFIPGAVNHNMTSGTPPNSPNGIFATTNGQTTCLRFTATGTFPFYCSVHQFTGTITVN